MTEILDRPDGLSRLKPHLAAALAIENRPATLALLVGMPVVLTVWALWSTDVVLSRLAVMDLLYILTGGWHIANGQMAHDGFRDAAGQLNFLLTAIGIHVTGPSVRAFLVGEIVMLAGLLAAACAAAAVRLPLIATAVFVLFSALPAAMPVNIGDPLDGYTFAMSYNRYGWGAIGIISLILFVPPRWGRPVRRLDMVVVAAMLAAMFYIKLTYFVVGIAGLTLALFVSAHVRAARAGWAGLLVAALANASAPHSHAYLADFLLAATSGGFGKTEPANLVRVVFNNATECAFYGTGVIIALQLWRRGLAPFRLPAGAMLMFGGGIALLSQNAQPHGAQLGIVIAFLLYDALARPGRPLTTPPAILAALLLAPLMTIGAMVIALAGYHVSASRPGDLHVVDRTNLRGLALPRGETALHPNLWQSSYVATLIEAADLFAAAGGNPGRVQVLDRINPLPFVLGAPPPPGRDLWWEPGMPTRPAEDFLGAADHALLPKIPPNAAVHVEVITHYSDYLARHFPFRRETEHWMVMSRRPLGI